MAPQEIRVPDIGDFHDVPVIEIHVAAGRHRGGGRPAGHAGERQGDHGRALAGRGHGRRRWRSPSATRSRAGTLIGTRVTGAAAESPPSGSPARRGHRCRSGAAEHTAPAGYGCSAAPPAPPTPPHRRVDRCGHALHRAEGRRARRGARARRGPGGYTAAFRAADLGKKVVLVDSRGPLGGVCLNIGCIPSKALLHAAKVIAETKEMAAHGLSFADADDRPRRPARLEGRRRRPAHRRTGGLAKQRKVTTIVGTGTFTGPNTLAVTGPDGPRARCRSTRRSSPPGSEPVQLPFVPHDDPRVIDSTGALALERIPERLLVLGGGIIGLEMATVYAELGSSISVVELMDQLIPGADKDIVTPLTKRIAKAVRGDLAGHQGHRRAARARTGSPSPSTRRRSKDRSKAPETAVFDAVLVAVGRRPNGKRHRRGRTRACSSTSAASSRSTSSSAPTSGTSSPSATSSGSRCSRTRPCTRARSPPRTPPGRRATSTPRSSRRWPTPIPRSRGSASPRTRPRPPG